MLRHVSDVLQGFCEGVKHDRCPDTALLIEDLEDRRLVVVRQLQLQLCVGRSEVVLGILELDCRVHDCLVLVFFGDLLGKHLQWELSAAQVVVYLLELVAARLYSGVVDLLRVLLELAATWHLGEGSLPICLVEWFLAGDAVGLRDVLGSDRIQPLSSVCDMQTICCDVARMLCSIYETRNLLTSMWQVVIGIACISVHILRFL